MVNRRIRQQLDRETTTTPDAVDIFILSRQAKYVTESTLIYYRKKLLPFGGWCTNNGAPNIEDVTADHVRRYIVNQQRRKFSPYTIHSTATAIRAFLRFCADDGLIGAAPKFQMPKLPRRILPAYELSDVQRLLNVCENDRDRLIILVLLDTGLRAFEFVALDGCDVDDKTGTVLVQMGKGRKGRIVYLGLKTRRELGRYWRKTGRPAPDEPIWCNLKRGSRLTADGLRQLLARLGRAADVEPCNPHTFRRTFALWSLRNGMSIYHLQRLMGHEDIDVLKRYLALVDGDIRSAQSKYSAADLVL